MAFNGREVLFRVRLGGNSSASKGYSFLIDSDGVFNKQRLANGTLVDYTTPSKVKNLGFEYEVVLALNFDVVVYRHRGSGDDNDPFTSNVIWRGSTNGGYSQFLQKAIAASMEGSNADYFFDFYVPLSAFSGDGGTGISPNTPLRITGSSVTSAQTGLEGTISDVGGLDDRLYGNDRYAIWRQLIPAFPPTSLNQIQSGEFCQSAAAAAPSITTSPITTSTTIINGNSSENEGTVSLFRNGVQIATNTVVTVSNGTFSFPLPSGTTLTAGDVITARVTRAASGNCTASTSVSSNSVTVTNVVKGQCATVAPSNIRTGSGSKTLTIFHPSNALNSTTLKVYRDGDLLPGTVSTPVAATFNGVNGFDYTFTTSINSTCSQFNFGYACSNAGSYATLSATATLNGCESARSTQVYLNGNTVSTTSTTSTSATPTISNTSLCSSSNVLSGTSEANSLIYLYIDNEPALTGSDGSIIASATANASGAWSFGLNNFLIAAGEVVTVKVKAPATSSQEGGTHKGLSPASNGITFGSNCTTSAPTISSVTPCPSVTTISGTSPEVDGTFVIVYRRRSGVTDLRVTEAGTVTRATSTATTGNWTAQIRPEIKLQGGDVLYAIATAPGGKTASTFPSPTPNPLPTSATTVRSAEIASSYGLTLTEPIKERATIITGTSSTDGIVNLYIEGLRIAGTAIVSGASATTPVSWSIAISQTNQQNLSASTSVTASISPTGDVCESQQTAAVKVSCVAPSTTPTLATAAQTVCYNNAAVLTVNNTENGIIYQVYNGDVASGPSMVGNGGTITISSGNLTSATVLTVRAFQVGAPDCQASLTGNTSITIAPVPTVYAVSPSSSSVCNGAAASVTVANSEEGVSYQIQVLISATGAYSNTGNAGAGTGKSLTLSTGTLTSSGTFRVVGVRNGCTTEMGNTFAVMVPSNALTIVPSVQSVCAGSTATVTIQNSDNGVIYQLQRLEGSNYVNTGQSVTSTGGNISLTTAVLSVTGANTFRVLASSGQCTPFALTQQITVNVSSGTPLTYNVTPTTLSICSGQAASLTLSGSQLGIHYQIYSGTTPIGNIVEGTGNAITLSSGAITSGGTFTVRASNSCGNSVTMGNTTVTVNPTPTAFAFTPTSQAVCNNATASVSLAGSQLNVNYQIQVYNPGTGTYNNTGAIVAGTGGAITLITGALTSSANLKVVATNSNGCSLDMSNRAFVAVPSNNLTVSTVTPTVCTGSTGQVRVVASETEVFYQLYVGTTAVGTAMEGTGGDIILVSNAITANTTFTVRATASSPAGCTFQVGSSVTVNVSAPVNQTTTLATTSSICRGSNGSITLASSQQGVTYQMYNGTTPTGTGVAGTGGAITLTSDPLTSNASLQVFAISSGCSNTAIGSSYSITVNSPPTQYSFESTQKIIRSGDNVSIELPITQNGVEYQIYNGSTPTGNRVMETGGGIVLTSGPISSSTTLTVQAIGTGGCGNVTMKGFTSVSIDSAPLPVTLTSFSVKATANSIQLRWSTATEKDNDFFQVERSIGGRTFTSIGQVKGNGTTNVVQTYTFIDASAPEGNVYYRLKQVDFDGKYEYTKVVSVKSFGNKVLSKVSVTPNPFAQQVSISISNAEENTVQVELYDINQKLMYAESAEVTSGKVLLKKDLSRLSNGVYLLRLTTKSLSEVIRIVKKD
ncbi:T9SS type A sorting domain-containing protein [Rufibacter tibetensis]|nr:T9SS type A sorting domain-containing protein [Rufibacter tibetensis]